MPTVRSGRRGTALDQALMRAPGFRATAGIVDGTGIALLGRRALGEGTYELEAHGYGPDGDELAVQLAAQIRAWDEAGPSPEPTMTHCDMWIGGGRIRTTFMPVRGHTDGLGVLK
jgi:hypothetical protein